MNLAGSLLGAIDCSRRRFHLYVGSNVRGRCGAHSSRRRHTIAIDIPYLSGVSLDAWGRKEDGDDGRAKRLAGSYAAAFVLVAGLLVVGAVYGGQIKRQVLEEEVDVKFVAPEKKPEPPPPPPPPPPKIKAATQGPPPPLGPKVDAPPTEIPKDKPTENDPSKAMNEVPFGEGDPNGCVGCTGKPGGGGGIPAPPVPPPPTPAASPRPYQIAEVTTPPVAITKSMPAYPEEARKQGIDMVVVVKFVVTESGDVEDIKILNGHPTLDQVVIDTVKIWKFTPGTLDGKAVRVVRKMKFPFHLRTAN